LTKEGHTYLCAWQPKSLRFETKYNAAAMGLKRDECYDFRVVEVEEWDKIKDRPEWAPKD